MGLNFKNAGLLIGIFVAVMFAIPAKGSAALPDGLVRMKPYVSTSKTGFNTKSDVILALNAAAKVQRLRNIGYSPVTGWMFDPKGSMKSIKSGADVSGMTKVNLPNSWGKDASGFYRTDFTMPQDINGFSTAGGGVSLAVEGNAAIDVYIDGKRVKTITGSGEFDLSGLLKPGESVVLGVKVTDMTQRGRFGSARLHATELDALKQPADDILSRLESARLLFDQMPEKQKALIEAVTTVSREAEALKSVSSVPAAMDALAKMKSMLAPVDDLLSRYPIFNQGPYLQNVKQDEITVMWETRIPASSAVYYGKDGLTEVVSDPEPALYHKVVIKGLKPQTEYKYLAVSNKLAAPESTFRTSINRDTPFKFAIFADDQSNPQIFEPIVDMIIGKKPDLVFSVGDQVGTGSEYEAWAREFFRPLRRLIINTPFFVAIGNHEYSGYGCGNPVPWFERFESVPAVNKGYYYAVTYGNSRFVILNQQESIGCNDVVPGTAQFDWLLKEFESEEFKKADFRFVLMHKPPYSQTWSGGYYDGEPSLREYLVPLLEKHKVDIIFSGHTHTYERGQWPRPDGVYYIITGGAGGGLDDTKYKDWPQMQMYKFIHHYSFVEIDGKKLKFTAIDDKGSTIDSFEINKK